MAGRSLWNIGILLLGAVLVPAVGNAASISAHVVTQTDAPAEDAVVSVVHAGQPAVTAKPGTRATMAQQNRQFVPFVLPIQVGTTVDFPNKDLFRHQVYSFSPAKTFELKLYGGDEARTETFDKEGVVALGCNIHDNMLAYIYVVGTPYFALSDGDGRSTLKDLPAGNYTVKVWHPGEKAGEVVTKDVTLAASDTAQVELKIDVKHNRRQQKPSAVDEKEY